MCLKKISCFLVVVMLLTSVFALSSAAARTGEFEMYPVEFDALVPDDLAAPIEIVLTHKTEGYSLSYCLYRENSYFSNEQVPPGEYDVSVNVGTFSPEFFGLIYDETLVVEPWVTAKQFLVLVNYSDMEGDTPEDAPPVSSEVIGPVESEPADVSDIENSEGDANNDVSSEIVPGDSHGSGSGLPGLLTSALISAFVLGLGVAVLWWWNNKR